MCWSETLYLAENVSIYRKHTLEQYSLKKCYMCGYEYNNDSDGYILFMKTHYAIPKRTTKKKYQRFNEINATFEGRRSGVSKHNTDNISMLRAKVSWKSVDTKFTSV